MSRFATIALLVGAFFALTVPATASARKTLCSTAHPLRLAVIHKHGKDAPGRDICRWDVLIKRGKHRGETRPATNHEKGTYVRQLRALKSPPPSPLLRRVASPPAQAPAGTATASVAAGGTLNAIAQCESGGNPQAVNPNGHYGKYQFDLQTWQSVGGSGNPAAASEAEQDTRAAKLYSQRGGSPWACAR